jgi:hypothetical protein
MDLAKINAFIALVRKSMDPAALQLVLAVVLFAAIQGYAEARESQSDEAGDKDQLNAERDALLAINEALKDGHISDAERAQLSALLGLDFNDPALPDALRWLVAEIANAPVTDGPGLLDQVRAKIANWLKSAENTKNTKSTELAKEGDVKGPEGDAQSQIFKAISEAANEFERGGFETKPAYQQANFSGADFGAGDGSFELTGVQFGNALPGGNLLDIQQFTSFAELLGPNASQLAIAEASDPTNLAYYTPGGALGGLGAGGGGGGVSSVASSGAASGASSGASSGGSFGGAVIDGYVENTLVFIDADGDYVWDTNEFWAITDSSGAYTLNYTGSIAGLNIVTDGSYYYDAATNTVYTDADALSKWGNNSSNYLVNAVDVTTQSIVDSAMVSSSGSGYITPISTIYAYAGAGGNALLANLGLSAFDLTYDPQATVNTNANAATVLKTGASLLTMVSNAAALVSSVGGVSSDVAVKSVFSKIATLGAGISDLFNTTGTTSQTKFTAILESSITAVNSSVNVASFSDVIAASSQSVTAVTNALQALSTDAIKAGDHLSIAATGQTTLLADIKSVSALVAAGDATAAAKITALTNEFTSANISTLAATAATKLAFNTQDPNNPIKTSADTVTIGAPVGTADVIQRFDILKNDTITVAGATSSGSVALDLAAVGIFTANARNGAIVGGPSTVTSGSITKSTIQLETLGANPASSAINAYTGMSITLLSPTGSITRTIESYNSSTKVATLSGEPINPTVLGSNTSYLISKALPSNIELAIVGDQLQITNRPATDLSLEVGQLELVYVAQKAGDPSIAKTGLVTVNVLPPKPTVAFAGPAITASEAIDGASGGAAPVTIAGREGDFTVVDAPLTLTGGLGLTGTIQISGLPTGALLQVGSTVIAKDVGSNFWTISQQSAPGADLTSLKVLIPSDLAATYTLSVVATARYGGLATQSSTSTTSLTVTPSADGLVLADGDAGTLTAFTDQAVPDAVNEDTPFALVNSEATPAIEQLISALQLRRGDSDGSEFLGLKLELPKDWLASFTTSSVNSIVTVQSDKTIVEIYAADADATSLKAALAALRLTAAPNYSGDATVKLTAGTFEAASAVNGVPSAANFKALPTSFDTNITVAPVSDTPLLNTSAFAANWNQATYLRSDGFYSVPVSVSAVSTDTVTPAETMYLAVGKAELDAVGASLNVPSATLVTILGKAYFRFASSDGNFEIVTPNTVSKPLTLSVLAGASDQGAEFAYSSAKTVTIPFVETPKTPSFSIKATSGYSEDAGISLSDLLLIAPGAGREIATHKVFIKLPDDTGYALSKSGTVIARTGDGYAVADLATGSLADFKIVTPANFKGTISNLEVFVRDTTSTGAVANASPVSTSVAISAVADGINATL